MNDIFDRATGANSSSQDQSSNIQDKINEFKVPNESPTAIAIAYHASRGEMQKIKHLKEYLSLQDARAKGENFNRHKYEKLQKIISEEYLLHTDAGEYLNESYRQTDAGQDYHDRYAALKKYLETFSGDNAHQAVATAMERSNDTNKRRRGFAQSLQKDVSEGNKVWKAEGKKWEGAEYLERNFPDMLHRSLDVTIGRINTSIRLAKEISGHTSPLSEEYKQSMQRIDRFLDTFNEREDINLVDLMYYIGEHRDATTFRGSTNQYYSEYEALVAGLTHTMPTQEKQRENIDLIHHCVDSEFKNLTHALKLSYLNVKHNVGLTTEDIDIYSTTTSTISNIMRAFGVSEMDDRSKQHFHNSGDHSLRTILTIVSIRDTNIARFESMHAEGKITEEQLERQKNHAIESATYLSKVACLHDSGEYLGELLGNNLVGRSTLEEKLLRALRDQTENHIMQEIIPQELIYRLHQGDTAERWEKHDIKNYIGRSLHPDGGFNFKTEFYENIFDIFERLQTNHDITSLREVGRINHEGNYENANNAGANDILYTMQYVHSKITGHKFQTTDPVDVAKFNLSEYHRNRAREDYLASNKVASWTSSPLPHNPDVTRVQDLPNTSLPLDVFMEEKDLNYEQSLFKEFVNQTIENHRNLSPEDAAARQAHDEALIHGICYEMNHYARKLAKTSKLDSIKIDKATRKSIAQGILMAKSDLEQHGIELQHLELPEQILDKKRYRVASVNTSQFLGGFLGTPDQPQQLFEPLQDIIRGIRTVLDTIKENILSPVWKAVKTPVQGLTLIDLSHVTEDDFNRLFQICSVLEAGGDLSLAATGISESASSADSGFDAKSIAALNPLLTFALAAPQRHAEAVEKCYGHVLHMFGEQIAEKYGLEDSIGYLKTKSNMQKGPYHKKPTDRTLSGELSEKMYGYFKDQYKNKSDTKPISNIEKSEKYILREMISYEITKTTNRLLQESSPAQRTAWEEKLATLKDALNTPSLSGNKTFRTLAKYNMEIRGGSIGTLGAMMASSATGADIGHVPVLGDITTSTIFGLNLALAGYSGMFASIKDRMDDMPHSHFLNRMDNLPHFERGKDGGVYIVKSASHKIKGTNHENTEALIKDIMKSKTESPNIAVQFFDTTLAVPVSAIRALSNRETSSIAFENQNTAQTVDSLGVIKKAFTETTSVTHSGIQVAAAVSASMFFRRVGVLNMFMNEIRNDIQNNRAPDFEIIKERIRDNLRNNSNSHLLNAMGNIGKVCKDTPVGHAGAALERVMFNDTVSKSAHTIIRWQNNIKKSDLPKHEPE